MVSIWPWKGEDNSPASFEKTLSALAERITKSQIQLDSLRARGRRLKGIWTLYAIFAYLLCLIISMLVVGWKNLTPLEYTALAGSPLLIYLVRTGITSYYNFRVESVTQRIDEQQAERTKTIEKLKAATKYNSTQQLLEKYGAATPAKPKKQSNPSKPKPANATKQLRKTFTGPPATANIPRPNQNQIPNQTSNQQPIPQVQIQYQYNSHLPTSSPITAPVDPGPAEFAPNAFSVPPQYAHSGELATEGHWYDRVLDLLMGEDETNPKNRMALICHNCRLVNGQAPPGIKAPAELGKWRCYGCGELNGEEDEAVKVVQEMKERIEEGQQIEAHTAGLEAETNAGSAESEGEDNAHAEQEASEQDDLVKIGDLSGSAADEGEETDTIEVQVKPVTRGRQKGGSRSKKA